MLANATLAGWASLVLLVGIYLPLYIVFAAISDWRLRRLHKHYPHSREVKGAGYSNDTQPPQLKPAYLSE